MVLAVVRMGDGAGHFGAAGKQEAGEEQRIEVVGFHGGSDRE